MRLSEILHEGIVVHGIDLLAYAIVVAEAYNEKPRMEKDAIPSYTVLANAVEKSLGQVKSKADVSYSSEDPYKTDQELMHDVVKNRSLKVWTGASDTHPMFTPEMNHKFRAVHDYFAHVLPNYSSIQKTGTPKSHRFTLRGEFSAFLSHSKTLPPAAIPAMFTEVIGQATYNVITGGFPEQKVIILDGFDYRKVGIMTGQRQARFNELKTIITDESQSSIPTNLNGFVLNKSEIDWKAFTPKGEPV